jgi:DnaJ-domain-containing protein 1
MIKKLSKALEELGLSEDWFNQLKAEEQAEKIVVENGLLPSTGEDVDDEYEQLEADVEKVDENDESLVDMNDISPTMRNLYSRKIK